MSRKRKERPLIVNEEMLLDTKKLVKLVNSVEGPIVEWDSKRGCYGLKADKDYAKKKIVTFYEGLVIEAKTI